MDRGSEIWAELVKASSAINSSLDLAEVLDAVARSAAVVMEAEASSVLILDRGRDRLQFAAASGPVSVQLFGQHFDAGLGIAGRVVSQGKPEIVRNVEADPAFLRDIDKKSAFRTREVLAAPMIFRGVVLGVVEVLNRKGGDFDERDLVLIQLFADLAATGLHNAQKHARVVRDREGFKAAAVRGVPEMIGASPALNRVNELCARVAPSYATVLLSGETGTGKEVTARHVHALSDRRDRPFIAVNCAALTETLLESELFGHEKGAFTGAVDRRKGCFELADGGTLFLDEIGDMTALMQVKLLRVLQEREFTRVGGTESIRCDTRIIAATNRDLAAAVAADDFREDLFYRLNVFPIELPPLRERREDIPRLVAHFLQSPASQLGIPVPEVHPDVIALLTAHAWPGNIRELQNVVERMVLMCDDGEILALHVPREIVGGGGQLGQQSQSGLRGYERAMIVQALQDHDWNQTRAAEALSISRDNLRYRVKKYAIEKPG